MTQKSIRTSSAIRSDDIHLRNRFFDEAPMGMICIDGKTFEIKEANTTFKQITDGVDSGSFFNLLDSESQNHLRDKLSKLWMRTQRFEKIDLTFSLKNGRKPAYVAFIAPISEEEEISRFYFYFTESSERKALEMQLIHAGRMQAMGQISGGIAHDFNNLLTAILGFSELLLERHQIGDPSFTEIMQIKQNAHRAAGLVSQLLAFSKKQPLKQRLLNFNEAFSDLIPLLRQSLGPNCHLEITQTENLGFVKVDPHQLTQVFLNLSVNARDAMSNKGTLSITTSHEYIKTPQQLGTERIRIGDYIKITVSDTGCGIPDEHLTHIFEPFFTTKEGIAGSGTGLGLSTVYGIISQTDGYIGVKSTLKKGTTFTVYLPRFEKKESFTPTLVQPEPEIPTETNKHILLVEDEDAVRSLTATTLRKQGYLVTECPRAETALSELQKKQEIDLLLSDIGMPGMDGHTLAQIVREQYPNVRIVLMSGYYEDFDKGGKGIDFLAKPFSLKALKEKIVSVLK